MTKTMTDSTGRVLTAVEREWGTEWVHRHEAKTTRVTPYDGTSQSQRAAGNVTELQTCSCGMSRKVHANGGHRSATRWA